MGTEHLTKLAGTSLEKALARPFSQETLVSWFKSTLESRRCTRIEAIRASKLNSTFGYQIIAGSRHASRDKLLQLAFGLELTPEETSRMLTLGGHAPPHGGRPPRHHRGVVPRKRSRARGGGRHPLEPRREHSGRPLTRARAYVLGGADPVQPGPPPVFSPVLRNAKGRPPRSSGTAAFQLPIWVREGPTCRRGPSCRQRRSWPGQP